MACSLGLGASSTRTRRLYRPAAKAGSGATGMIGTRSASSGSVRGSGIAALLIDVAELPAGPHQQRLSGPDAAVKDSGSLGHAQAVQVAKSQHGAMLRSQRTEDLMGA